MLVFYAVISYNKSNNAFVMTTYCTAVQIGGLDEINNKIGF